jgi:type VI secretion system protein ImpH
VTDAEPAPLGENCVLGGGFFDRSNAVRIVITPDSRASVVGLMPGQSMHGEVMRLLRFYLGYEAQAVFDMHVRPDLMPTPMLDAKVASLGYTAMLACHNASSTARAPVKVQLGSWNRPSRYG